MKKTLAILLIILLPACAYALRALSDEELEGVSGRSGVSIMPNVCMSIHIDVIAWGDSDGLGANNIWGVQTTGGYVGTTNLSISNLWIGSRTGAFDGMWPITINVSNGVAFQSVDESYIRYDAEALKNPLLLSRMRLQK